MKIIHGDSLHKIKELEDNSIDAVVTDPPYGLSFMGKKWDYDVPSVELWKECLRVLKHGGMLLSFAGSRTYHRMAVNIEDAGFEIRDQIMWIYGSGFPKSHNIGKAVDKLQGNEREEWEEKRNGGGLIKGQAYEGGFTQEAGKRLASKGTSPWEGWGTALKPACEPIVVARKPLSEKNVALNVLKWGTGGINIDACRVGSEPIRCSNDIRSLQKWKEQDGRNHKELINPEPTYNQGRFPANIILDEEAGKILDEQSGISKSQGGQSYSKTSDIYGEYSNDRTIKGCGFKDKGGASRFFYCAKASKSERNLGCEGLEKKPMRYEDGRARSMEIFSNQYTESSGNPTGRGITNPRANNHPTVKPIKLMEYLIKLVSKEGAVVLDPFLGSGTTLLACQNLNRKGIGIEREEDYIKIAQARLNTSPLHSNKNKEVKK